MAVSAVAAGPGALAAREQRGGRLWTAATLIGPATVFVTVTLLVPILILFRYSLNAFVPGKLMVEALTVENYRLFFVDPYYLAAFYRTLRVAVIVTRRSAWSSRFPSPSKLARTAEPLQEPADHAGGPATVRRQPRAGRRLDDALRPPGASSTSRCSG